MVRRAERIDPRFAMAYWGEAMCFNQPLWFNEDLDKGRDAIARMDPAQRARPVTSREQAYIAAVERLFGSGDKPARDRAYADSMRELARTHPEDDEAAAFYALALLATIAPGQPNTEISLKAGAIASAILRLDGGRHQCRRAHAQRQRAGEGP